MRITPNITIKGGFSLEKIKKINDSFITSENIIIQRIEILKG